MSYVGGEIPDKNLLNSEQHAFSIPYAAANAWQYLTKIISRRGQQARYSVFMLTRDGNAQS